MASKAKAALNRNATTGNNKDQYNITEKNKTEGGQEQTTKKQALCFLRNFVLLSDAFFFLSSKPFFYFYWLLLLWHHVMTYQKLREESGRNSAIGVAIVCKNVLINITIYPAPNYLYEVIIYIT